jgi:ketosteroid isomerase-like protein
MPADTMTRNERTDARELARRFLRSVAAKDLGELRELLDDAAVFWTNVTQTDVDKQTRLQQIALEFRTFESFAFLNERIDDCGDGFVVRAQANGSLPGGEAFAFPICIVAECQNGRIRRLEEYLDPRAVAPILRALAASAPH